MSNSDFSDGTASNRPLLLRNGQLLTLSVAREGLGIIQNAAVVIERGRILFAGPESDLPSAHLGHADVIDLQGRWVTPGLIDCHTHIIHGGNRAAEFEMRLEGVTYEEIARRGGGIVSSVAATRALDVEGLLEASMARLDTLIGEGVTTIEIKSGYGLSIGTELDMLRAARRLAGHRPLRVTTSYLGAHSAPSPYSDRKDDFLTDVVLPGLSEGHAEGLIDAVDGFCEGIGFSPAQIGRVFDAARALGLPVKLHADQLSDLGGAALAARYRALSADHLEYTSQDGVAAMAASGTVAVMLPGAYYAIRETRKPPIDLFRAHGVPMALATDCNPGTSPLTSLLLAMNLGATLFGMTVAECLAGVTRHAAQALGLDRETGTIQVGKSADLAIWDIGAPAELVYKIGFNPLYARIFQGDVQFRTASTFERTLSR